ncbi:MAG TPA: 2-hydroxyacyl-CoA dehydratase [Firmicutes bacterium]|nr:2-hydroxyacyl-CoA dehydratase [Bacillota bacterium]
MPPISQDTDRPVIYYTCSYVPPEVIWAGGGRPVRLLPDEPAPGWVDAQLPRDYCPYVRAAFAQLTAARETAAGKATAAGEARPAGEAKAVVLTTCCDPMRRLADLLAATAHGPGPTALLLDVPREQGQRGQARFAQELRTLCDHIETITGSSCGDLAATLALYAHLRHLLRQVRCRLEGSAFHRLLRRALTADPLVAGLELEQSLHSSPAGSETAHGPTPGGPAPAGQTQARCTAPPLLVITSHPVNPGLLEAIEGEGARLVAEDSCLGDRLLDLPPPTGEDGWDQLAASYLTRPPCPRMDRPQERLAYLQKLASTHGARGAVILALKYCDNLSYDYPWVKEGLHLPVLFLEADYGTAMSGQVRTRVQAFLESL